MAATYQACSAALTKLGEPEAAWIAADFAMAAVDRQATRCWWPLGPVAVASGTHLVTQSFVHVRRPLAADARSTDYEMD